VTSAFRHAGLEFAPLPGAGGEADSSCSLKVADVSGVLGLIGVEQEDRSLLAHTHLAARARRTGARADCLHVLWELARLAGLRLRVRIDERDAGAIAATRRLWPGQPHQPIWLPDARCGGRVCVQWDVHCAPAAGEPLEAEARCRLRAVAAATAFGRRHLVGPEPLELALTA
jgi:hypothetical protein